MRDDKNEFQTWKGEKRAIRGDEKKEIGKQREEKENKVIERREK